MQEREILTHLKDAVEEITPDCFEDIWEKSLKTQETPDFSFSKKRNGYVKWGARFAAIAACFLCFIGYRHYQVLSVYSTVNLDINPSIQICANRQDEVLSVEALNEDAEKVVALLPQEKREKLDTYVDLMIQEIAVEGYLVESDSSILVSVENKNAKHAEELKTMISEQIEKTMVNQQVEGNVISQVMEKENQEVRQLSEEMHISKGKATFIHNIASQNKDLSEKKLAKMTITEIVVKAEKKEWKLENGCKKKVKKPENVQSDSVTTYEETGKPLDHIESTKEDEELKLPEQNGKNKGDMKDKDATKKDSVMRPEYKEEEQQYTKTPNTTNVPKESLTPDEIAIPVDTGKTKKTKDPKVSEEPDAIWKPEVSWEPTKTKGPKQTKEPEQTQVPIQTQEPNSTQAPDQTQETEWTSSPKETKGPIKTKGPKQSQKPDYDFSDEIKDPDQDKFEDYPSKGKDGYREDV